EPLSHPLRSAPERGSGAGAGLPGGGTSQGRASGPRRGRVTSAVENEGSGCVAYQGAPGAFSHEACLDLRPWDEAVGCETFQEAIGALLSGQCQFAPIPVENPTVGTVGPAASLVREAGLVVVSGAWRPIRLALLGLPEARLSHIRPAESHPVALQQCSKPLG